MTDIPPISELLEDPEEFRRLQLQIRAEQRARWGRWYYLLHPLLVVYATIFMLLRSIVGNMFGFAWAVLALVVRLLAIVLALLFLLLLMLGNGVLKLFRRPAT